MAGWLRHRGVGSMSMSDRREAKASARCCVGTIAGAPRAQPKLCSAGNVSKSQMLTPDTASVRKPVPVTPGLSISE